MKTLNEFFKLIGQNKPKRVKIEFFIKRHFINSTFYLQRSNFYFQRFRQFYSKETVYEIFSFVFRQQIGLKKCDMYFHKFSLIFPLYIYIYI